MTQMDAGNNGRAFGEDEYPCQDLTGLIIGAALDVHRAFGFGFLEAVYRRSLAVELRYRGIEVAQDVGYELFHRGVPVGIYRADLVAESTVIIEAKAGRLMDPTSPDQLLNYLRASGLPIGLVLHFGPRLGIKRVIARRPNVTGVRRQIERDSTEAEDLSRDDESSA